MNLTIGEFELLLNFLEDYGSKVSNDLSIEASEENRKMCEEYAAADGFTDENAKEAPWEIYHNEILTFDWWICAHIRRKLQNYLTQQGGD